MNASNSACVYSYVERLSLRFEWSFLTVFLFRFGLTSSVHLKMHEKVKNAQRDHKLETKPLEWSKKEKTKNKTEIATAPSKYQVSTFLLGLIFITFSSTFCVLGVDVLHWNLYIINNFAAYLYYSSFWFWSNDFFCVDAFILWLIFCLFFIPPIWFCVLNWILDTFSS